MRTARRGRGAGPARRFAVRVLLERCALGHADAARALGTSTKTVANMVHRAKTAPASPEIAAWLARWDADAGHPGGEANEPRPAKAEVGTARAARVAAAKPRRGK
ncbi:MAG: hypothetical protein U1F43_22900 [Myxococcota bacterium]